MCSSAIGYASSPHGKMDLADYVLLLLRGELIERREKLRGELRERREKQRNYRGW
jgi:hypothetical protein